MLFKGAILQFHVIPKMRSVYVRTIGVHGSRLVVQSTNQTIIIVAISSDLLPVFGKIIDVLIVSVTECYFVCELLVTDSFIMHMKCNIC